MQVIPNVPDAVWLNLSPSLQAFNCPLLHDLSNHVSIDHWEYSQTLDEPASLEIALDLLTQYLDQRRSSGQDNAPVHLLGHNMGGLLGLLYARRYPQQVKSLTLLAVGANPAITWQAHYYTLLELLVCDRRMLLHQMVHQLFGSPSPSVVQNLVRSLEQDLEQSPSLHSLLKRGHVSAGGAAVPMLVCGSKDDAVVDPTQIKRWKQWLKPSDRLWLCPGGRHFFHYIYAELVAEQIIGFWDRLEARKKLEMTWDRLPMFT
ncbi:MAG: alpha/beta fold hydrolase [Microcoleaceae cyanobacterium]